MDGLINLNKPTGITSAKALYRVRKITGVRKSGHAGTLDPAASGVLLLCLGRATKLVESMMDLPKVYRAWARLDQTSDSFDSEGAVRSVEVAKPPAPDEVMRACASLEGRIEQVPPAVSALKVGGRPAYKLARAGRDVGLPARTVHVYWIHVRDYTWPAIEFEVACGRGTYIRALIRDLGNRLNTGGCLTGLERRAVGPWCVGEGWTLVALEAGELDQFVVPLDRARAMIAAGATPPPRPDGG